MLMFKGYKVVPASFFGSPFFDSKMDGPLLSGAKIIVCNPKTQMVCNMYHGSRCSPQEKIFRCFRSIHGA